MRKYLIGGAVIAVLAAGLLVIFLNPGGPRPDVDKQAAEKPVEEKGKPALVDEVVVVEEASQSAGVARLEAGEFHLYADGLDDPQLFRRIEASAELAYERSFGASTELTFNPVGPSFPGTGKLNPFAVPRIREAMNWLIDREHIAQEIYGGLAVPRYLPINRAFPDYTRLADVARKLEIRYAHDPKKAKRVITEEMERLGAQNIDGKWHYQGEKVTLIFLIRVEDKRREIGDYVATLLEDLGFVVDRQYKTAAEASPIWIRGDPADGRFHIYTAGWISTVISRDQGGNFNFYYTPRGRPEPLWQAYKPTPEFDEVSDRLDRSDYATWEERGQLFARALELALEDSVRIWITDTIDVWGRRKNVQIAADLAGGVSGSWLWPYTLRFTDRAGGTMKIGLPSMLPEPWNPISGSNWIFDTMLYRATGELATLPDPFTGLYWPQRIKSAEVSIKEGLPVTRTLDWLTLEFLPEIEVPADAFIDWETTAQRFIPVGEKHPEGLTANRKVVVHFADDLYKLKWHDGSTRALGDIIMGWILTFERANEKSPIFDEAYVPDFQTFQRHFRGFRIVQQDPLVIEYYSDLYYPDAEWNAADAANAFDMYYGFGPGPWHTVALGVLAEQNKELAFTTGKADRLKIERMNYIAGPSLAILEKHLKWAQSLNFIPYAPTLSVYISAEEAKKRWENLLAWYQAKKHFWVGMGAFYLDAVRPVERQVVLKRFAEFPDPQDKWLRFSEPWIAEVSVTGEKEVKLGYKASFEVEVAFKGEAYPAADIAFVKYLVFDARGELFKVGEAEAVGDGRWRISLSAEETAKLTAGSNRLEVIVAPRRVSIPSFESLTFVTGS